MDENVILSHERDNDGQSVFLFYDDMAGLYLAFGLSAYFTTMVVNPYISYSDKLQMPVALLKRGHILYLRQSMTKVEHIQKQFYHFRMRTMVGDAGYERWVKSIESIER